MLEVELNTIPPFRSLPVQKGRDICKYLHYENEKESETFKSKKGDFWLQEARRNFGIGNF